MFLLIITYGYILTALLLAYFILRDRKNPGVFFGRHRHLALALVLILALGLCTAFYATLAEPFALRTNRVSVKMPQINQPIKIAFVSDIQTGNHKKEAWSEKIAAKIEAAEPDIVILGGDQIDNEGTFDDESKYLEPLKRLSAKYPVFFILGNHEYGIGGAVRMKPAKYTGDWSGELINRLNSFGFILLRNSLSCLNVKQNEICLFGLDDIWKRPPNFSGLSAWDRVKPLILVTHNPDGALYLPKDTTASLVLSGHTHGGQIWIPLWGPLGNAQIILDKSFYRGLNKIGQMPVFTSVGAGESGAPLRLFAVPEIVLIELTPE